jgi:hypothetical protein
MISNLGARPIARVTIAILMSLALAVVIMATTESPASARRVRIKRSLPGEFVAPPETSEFTCYWVDRAAQYFCQGNRDDKMSSPPIGFALEAPNPDEAGLSPGETPPDEINEDDFMRPGHFSCSGSGADPAAYSCNYQYKRKTVEFNLDEAMAIIVKDDKTNEISIDTWFMPRH